MNQDKISETIKKIRKDNKLTQEALAKELGVTYQAVSKWENGKNIPDILILKEICSKYNIDINELLETKVKTKNKNTILISMLVLIIVILIVIFGIHLYQMNNSDDYTFRTINTTCDDFTLHGSVAFNKNKTSIYISNIDYCGKDPDIEYKSIESSIYVIDGNSIKLLTDINIKNNTNLENYLKDLIINIESLECDLLNEGLLLKIKAITEDDLEKNYELPLELSDSCPVKLN